MVLVAKPGKNMLRGGSFCTGCGHSVFANRTAENMDFRIEHIPLKIRFGTVDRVNQDFTSFFTRKKAIFGKAFSFLSKINFLGVDKKWA